MRTAPLWLAVALATAACVPRTSVGTSGNVDLDVEPIGRMMEDWGATLQGQSGFPNITGTAQAMTGEGQTMVTANLAGATTGGVHPWHIHAGTCGSGGPIVGDPGAYPPLQPASDGNATASAQIAVELNEAEDYHVDVHASPEDLGTIVACGELDD